MQGFDYKILPNGVEIFQQSRALTLQSIRQNGFLCNRISISTEVLELLEKNIGAISLNKLIAPTYILYIIREKVRQILIVNISLILVR